MDVLLSAVTGDLFSRLVTFLIATYQKQATAEKLARLQPLLLRAHTIVEEADERHITNQAMLQQLKQLRKDMYRGYYMLDTFKRESVRANRHVLVGQSFALKKLQRILQNLEGAIGDMKEFVVFLMDCPRMVHEPYSTYLFMESCMFGRHMEKEYAINFLLQPCFVLAVLPIIGPCEVGKRTLVEHVCKDEKVQKHFFHVQHLTGDNLDSGHPIGYSSGRSLIVIEFSLHVNEDAWKRFYSSACQKNSDSKIIIISRMKQAANLGTVKALELKRLHRYEFCYFFKVLAFGSVNPHDQHPELASIATNIAEEMKGSFVAANVLARLLRTNINEHFWRHVLKMINELSQLHYALFGEHFCHLSWKNRPLYLCVYIFGSLKDALFLSYSRCKRGILDKRELPKFTLHDLMTGAGSTIPSEDEKVDLLLWQSPILPYYSYTAKCAVVNAQEVANVMKGRLKRKRVISVKMKRKRVLQ